MEGLRQYLLSIICASLICGIVLSMVKEEGARTAVKLLCGAVLAMTVVSPLFGLDPDRLAELIPDSLDGAGYVSEGENMARQAMAQHIKQACEAYILDKASSLHADVEVEITLGGEDQVPVAAELTGTASPNARAQLLSSLQGELGIPKENIRWTG
ncbi:MAG: hypothetical protein Q4F17_02270 [Eubacteriales bacterium]|nr:hypothetical protein [Eubacteriales bacterium]